MKRRPLLRLAFWGACGFALTMALLPQPPQLPGQPSDKLQHILAFAVLAALGRLAYPRAPLLVLAAGLSAFGALIELLQAIPALNRDSELADWAADTAAVLAILLAFELVRRRNA